MKFNKKLEIYELSQKDVEELNSKNLVSLFPKELKRPTVSEKISIVDRKKTGGKSAQANKKIKKGEIICYSDGAIIDRPIRYSWQIGRDRHQVGIGGLDHDCTFPACGLDLKNNFIALRDIGEGEYVTFNYLTTEYILSVPFDCSCGAPDCYGRIEGFKFLSPQDKLELLNKNPSKYIRSLMPE